MITRTVLSRHIYARKERFQNVRSLATVMVLTLVYVPHMVVSLIYYTTTTTTLHHYRRATCDIATLHFVIPFEMSSSV